MRLLLLIPILAATVLGGCGNDTDTPGPAQPVACDNLTGMATSDVLDLFDDQGFVGCDLDGETQITAVIEFDCGLGVVHSTDPKVGWGRDGDVWQAWPEGEGVHPVDSLSDC